MINSVITLWTQDKLLCLRIEQRENALQTNLLVGNGLDHSDRNNVGECNAQRKDKCPDRHFANFISVLEGGIKRTVIRLTWAKPRY